MKRAAAFSFFSAIFLPAQSIAQDIVEIELDEALVVYDGLLPLNVDSTGTTVDVVDRTDLTTAGVSATAALDTVPGVSISSNGGLGTLTTLRIRGLDGKYIGVRIDGIEVTDPSSTQTSFNFGTLLTGAVDQISLIKGAQSSAYGSDAIAGVINVDTWRPDVVGHSGRAALEFGSYGTVSTTGSFGYLTETSEIALTIGKVRSDGFSARDSDTEADGFDQTSAHFHASHQVNESLQFGLSALWIDSTSEFDRSTTDPTGEADNRQRGLRAFTRIETGPWTHEFALSGYDISRFDAGGFTQSFIGERRKAEYLGSVDISETTEAAFGFDRTWESAELDGTETSASNNAIFGEIQHSLSDSVETALTLRYDDYSDFGGQLTGHGAIAWWLNDATMLRASLGTGFRAPSLYERFGPFAGSNLTPETSRSFDIGILREFGAESQVEATLFYTEIDDLIGFDLNTFQYSQISGTTISRGIELSGEHRVSDRVTLTGAYTYTDAATGSVRLIRVPRHELSLGVAIENTDRLSTHLKLTHASDTLDGFGVVTPLPDFTVIDVSARRKLSENSYAYLGVDNITNESYQRVSGYNTPGRTIRFGFESEF